MRKNTTYLFSPNKGQKDKSLWSPIHFLSCFQSDTAFRKRSCWKLWFSWIRRTFLCSSTEHCLNPVSPWTRQKNPPLWSCLVLPCSLLNIWIGMFRERYIQHCVVAQGCVYAPPLAQLSASGAVFDSSLYLYHCRYLFCASILWLCDIAGVLNWLKVELSLCYVP